MSLREKRVSVKLLALILTFFSLGDSLPAQAADKFVTIGTAGVTGVYYPAGGAICRLLNRGRKEHGIRCSVESTGGSIDNLSTMREGELDFAIVQSDWQYHAYRGTGAFAEQGPNPNLRAVFSLHSEAFTIVVRDDSSIKTFDDLKGKRVNVGNPGSGMRATMEEILKRKGWRNDAFELVTDLKVMEQGKALCSKNVDAVVYSGGHPNGAVQELTSACPVRIIDVKGPVIDAMVRESPFYAYATIPGGMYAGNPNDIRTFGVKATLVTSAKNDSEVVYQLVKAVFDNFDNFKTLHPVFSTLDPALMVMDGNTAPAHEGALRYYTERGMLGVGEHLPPPRVKSSRR